MTSNILHKLAATVSILSLCACGQSNTTTRQELEPETKSTLKTEDITPVVAENYSPYANRAFPENVYWGDLHVHTKRSPDAYTYGNRMDPMDAYRFAKGKTVMSTQGLPIRIPRPLDFLAVTDHASFMGVFPRLDDREAILMTTELGQRWAKLYDEGKRKKVLAEFVDTIKGKADTKSPVEVQKSVWSEVIAQADAENEPGKFTAFIGYEWTSMPNGNNLHRNVIFRDNADFASQILPFSAITSFDPEDLWGFLQEYEDLTGGKVLAIPHNGNISNGLMFSSNDYNGQPITSSYAQTRMRWEPLYEATQVKGDAEAHPFLSPNDEFADYFTWDFGNFGAPAQEKETWMLRHEYVRSSLKLGLELENKLGVNPFKYGLIGSTDSHSSMANTAEDNFFGKFATQEPISAQRLDTKLTRDNTTIEGLMPGDIGLAASGLAAIWAKENTREALFDAMVRKETYATTGTHIRLRFFGGWTFNQDDILHPNYAEIGYREGVPMGGDLAMGPDGENPRFMIHAVKDAEGANLDRIQVIKGWVGANGKSQETIYDVAVSDNRTIDPITHRAKPVKSTVDIATATYTNDVGVAELSAVWTDTEFDPSEKAFYYVRVLEIPTPRWSTYDAAFFGVEPPKAVDPIHQERAYSSPIWFNPQ